MTRQLGILGYPLTHSASPVMQQAALDHHGLEMRYSAWPTESDALAAAVGRLRWDGYVGANVTIPHKERVIELLDECGRLAREVGAVNTIVKEDGRLLGHNTDVSGFLRALKEQGGFDPSGASVILLGAGGAARAAALALAEEGVASLTIANRTLGRAGSLADELRGRVAAVAPAPLQNAALAGALDGADLIVNATSVGMDRSGDRGKSPLPASMIPSDALVYDMVYVPAQTPLLAEARKAGARTLGGLWMLVYQGAASFELWTGLEAPVQVMARAAERAVAATRGSGRAST